MNTADLCDKYEDAVHTLEPIGFRSFGQRLKFHGQISTLKIFEDNALVRTTFGENGQGRVLVIDAGASMRCAVVGDQLAALAAKNNWAGMLVYGCIRDSAAFAETNIGCQALGTHPRKTVKLGTGQRDIPVTFAGQTMRPGQFIYLDNDGIVISYQELTLD